MTMSNLLSTNVHVVVCILVSVYSHKHYSTLHGTYNMLHTTDKKIQNGPFSYSWSHIIITPKIRFPTCPAYRNMTLNITFSHISYTYLAEERAEFYENE